MTGLALVSSRKGLFVLKAGAFGTWPVRHLALPGVPITAALHDPSDGAIYAAANHGHFGAKLYRSDDGGATFPEIAVPAFPKAADGTGPSLIQIWVLTLAGPGDLYAGTIPEGLFRSRDRGQSWTLVEGFARRPFKDRAFGGGYEHPGVHSVLVEPGAPDRLICGISCGGVWASADAGAHWDMRTAGLFATYQPPDQAEDGAIQDPHLIAQCHTQPSRLWMQHHNGVFRSDDFGRVWHPLNPPVSAFGFAVAAHPQDPQTAWFAPSQSDEVRMPENGRFCVTRTKDGGLSFEVLSAGLPSDPAYDLVYRHGLAVDAQGERLLLGSTSGGFWTSADGGATWDVHPVRFPPLYAVSFG